MTQPQANIEKLISKKLAGKLSPAETQQLFDWISENKDNAERYVKMLAICSNEQIQSRKSAVWDKVRTKSTMASPVVLRQMPYKGLRKLSKVAAVLAFILLLPLALSKMGKDDIGQAFVHTVKANDIVTSFYLPDKSQVFLSRGSVMSYNDDYNESNRELILRGKAYIEINKNDNNMPVVVNSGKHCAIVWEGKIAIDSKDNQFEVAVNEGEATIVDTLYKKVIIPMIKLTPASGMSSSSGEDGGVSADEVESLKVLVGERATYSSEHLEKTEEVNYCELFSWKDKVFCFNNLKQHEIALKMSEWYGKSVEFKGELDPYQEYSGSFQNPTVEQLIHQIFNKYELKQLKETSRKITVDFS